MVKNSEEGGPSNKSALGEYLPESLRNLSSGESRVPARNKILAAVVATGAFVAVGSPIVASANGDDSETSRAVAPIAEQQPLSAAVNGTMQAPPSVELRGAKAPEPKAAPKADKSKPAPAPEGSPKAEDGKQAEEPKMTKAQRKAIREQIAMKKAFAKKAEKQADAKPKPKPKAAPAPKPAKPAPEPKPAPKPKPEPAPAVKAAPAPTASKLVGQGRLTSGYHTRGGTHAGIDVGADMGTPIYAPAGGEVISAGPASGFGLWVRVLHDSGKVTVYGHVNSMQVSVGERVEAGEQIATVGSRGQSTGPHLHFEVRLGAGGQETNPIPWLAERGINID